MKNLVVGMLMAVGVAACSSSDSGGSGGAGGIQDPEDTNSSSNSGGGDPTSSSNSTASGGECQRSEDGEALCQAIEECSPGKLEECRVELDEERCGTPECSDFYDDWVGCWKALADADDIPECEDYPDSCESQRTSWESCVAGDECTASDDAVRVCDAVEACEGDGEGCMEELEAERCLYADGSECRGRFDQYIECLADAVDEDNWPECPDQPAEACRTEFDDYAAACI